jgi:hypothetical protein
MTLQGDIHKREVMMTTFLPTPASRSLDFHPKNQSHTHQKRKQSSTMIPPKREMRETTPVNAAIIGTNGGERFRSKLLLSERKAR